MIKLTEITIMSQDTRYIYINVAGVDVIVDADAKDRVQIRIYPQGTENSNHEFLTVDTHTGAWAKLSSHLTAQPNPTVTTTPTPAAN